jgi:protein-S-isoprenylcysteine O-methyltransferase Ste14
MEPQAADNPGVVILPPRLYLGALALVLILRWFWRMPIAERSVTLWPGLVLAGLGLALGIWGRKTMTRAGTNVNPGRPTTTIVASGPFRFTRNPLYVAITAVFLGLTLAINTWWGVVALVPMLLVMHRGVVLREERYLESKFGESYRQYRARVRRYL